MVLDQNFLFFINQMDWLHTHRPTHLVGFLSSFKLLSFASNNRECLSSLSHQYHSTLNGIFFCKKTFWPSCICQSEQPSINVRKEPMGHAKLNAQLTEGYCYFQYQPRLSLWHYTIGKFPTLCLQTKYPTMRKSPWRKLPARWWSWSWPSLLSEVDMSQRKRRSTVHCLSSALVVWEEYFQDLDVVSSLVLDMGLEGIPKV